MARQTRAQRRALRAAEGAPERRPDRAPGNGGAAERRPDARPQQAQEPKRRFSFVRESWAELNKVEWPGQSQVIQATVVVLVACIVVGAYLFANDKLWQPVVQRLVGQ